MNELTKILLELMALLPPQLVNIGIVMYLIWFNQSHKKDHKEILDRLLLEEEKSKATEDKVDKLYMMALKGNIVNPHIPISARLEMYDLYKQSGGNSWVSQWVEDNLMGEFDEVRRKVK